MEYSEVVTVATQLLLISAVIALAVSVITEFLVKQLVTLSTKALNIFISCFSIALTVGVAVAYFQRMSISTYWYTWCAVVFIGFLVACIAMNGYDKIFSFVYEWLKGIFNESEEQ